MELTSLPAFRLVGYKTKDVDTFILRFHDGKYWFQDTYEEYKAYYQIPYEDIKDYTLVIGQLPTEEYEYFQDLNNHVCNICDQCNDEGHASKEYEGGWVCANCSSKR